MDPVVERLAALPASIEWFVGRLRGDWQAQAWRDKPGEPVQVWDPGRHNREVVGCLGRDWSDAAANLLVKIVLAGWLRPGSGD